MQKNNFLFEVIINNNCNKRCSYCKIDFYNWEISFNVIDNFISFLEKNIKNVEYFKINFFWWEPLLWFEKIQYFIQKAWKINHKIQYSIWTNGLLLNEFKIKFFNENSFKIYLSIDWESKKTFLDNKQDFDFKNLFVNFVITPNEIENTEKILKKIIEYWVLNINILPALWIYGWNDDNLEKLKNIFEKNNSNKSVNFNFYSYFNWFLNEKQFILETNWDVFYDLDSLIWIQRQNKNFSEKIKKFLKENSFLWNILNLNLPFFLDKYDKKNILRDIFLIAKYQKLDKIYKKIDKILKNR